ncbi:MAG: site-2 protease family protein [bacterium]
MAAINFGDMAIWYVAFLFSFTAHEASHALVAMRGGDLTAYLGGQVTLNPLPHILRSPFGTVVIPIISFVLAGWMIGWASAPYDPNWAAKYPRRAALMAAAGPAANFLIFIASFILIKLGLLAGVFIKPEHLSFTEIIIGNSGVWFGLGKLLSVFLILNLILLIFNLLPFPPLDGSGVVTLFMSDQTALRFRQFLSQPMWAFLGLVLAWRILPFIFPFIFALVLEMI